MKILFRNENRGCEKNGGILFAVGRNYLEIKYTGYGGDGLLVYAYSAKMDLSL
jgi:hypothetical protein